MTAEEAETPDRTKRWLWLIPAAVVAAVDLWTKSWYRYPKLGTQLPAPSEEWLSTYPIYNEGGIWSLEVPPNLLLVATALAVPLLILWLYWPARVSPWESLGKMLILGGAVGNLYDRFEFGAVRDFIHVYIKPFSYHYPTFNVADSVLVMGIAFLLLRSFRRPKET